MESRNALVIAILTAALTVFGALSASAGPAVTTVLPCNINDDGTTDLAFSGASTNRTNVITDAAAAANQFHSNGNGAWGLMFCEQVGSAAMISRGEVATSQNAIRIQKLNADGSGFVGESYSPLGGGAWELVGTADIDGDGNQDLIFDGVDSTPGEPFGRVSFIEGSNAGSVIWVGLAGGSFSYIGKGDVDADMDEDVFYVNDTGEVLRIDISNGTSVPTKTFISLGSSFWVAAIGDVNGDRKADLLLDSDTVSKVIQLENGVEFDSAFIANGGGAWTPTFIGDTNNDTTGDLVFVLAAGGSVRITPTTKPDLGFGTNGIVAIGSYSPTVMGDFDGDEKADIAGEGATGVQFTLLDGAAKKAVADPAIISNGNGFFSLAN